MSLINQLKQKMMPKVSDPQQIALDQMNIEADRQSQLAQQNPMNDFLINAGSKLANPTPGQGYMGGLSDALSAGNVGIDKSIERSSEASRNSIALRQAVANTYKAIDEYNDKKSYDREILNLKKEELDIKRSENLSDEALKRYSLEQKEREKYNTVNDDYRKKNIPLYENAIKMRDYVSELSDLMKKIKSGGWKGEMVKDSSGILQATALGADKALVDRANQLMGIIQVSAAAEHSKGRGAGIGITKLFKDIKPNFGMQPEAIQSMLGTMKHHADDYIKQSQFVENMIDSYPVSANKAQHAWNNYLDSGKKGDPRDYLFGTPTTESGIERKEVTPTEPKSFAKEPKDLKDLTDEELLSLAQE